MSVAKSCCTTSPVESSYTPKGDIWQLDDMAVYDTQKNQSSESSDRVLICVYDIFGFHPNTKQFADKLGACGFRVVMPDFFRGQPFPMEKFPLKDRQELLDYLKANVDWDTVVKKDIVNVMEHVKLASGQNTKFGIYGFCWGSKIACNAASEIQGIQAMGMVHPSFWTTDDADGVKCPTMLVPSKDEDDMIPMFNKLKERFPQSGHVRFDDMHHGFAAARGDFTNELNRKRAEETIQLLGDFFNKTM